MFRFNQKSIRTYFEIVWINDGSDTLNTTILKNLLRDFQKIQDLPTLNIMKMMEIKELALL